jgi:antitoxin component YwqK of YwqJK toxin-antitoxin module
MSWFRRVKRQFCRPSFLLAAGGTIVVIALVLKFAHYFSPSLAGRLELSRTNLVNNHGCWYQAGHTNPFTGVMLEFYPGGTPLSRSDISNGLLDGLSEGWFTNRQIQIRENYHTNYADGLRTKWYSNGNKLSEAMIAQGKIQGIFRRWHENGRLAEEIQMRDGKPDGVGRAYYESGCLKSESRIQAGQIIEQNTWKDGERSGTALRDEK